MSLIVFRSGQEKGRVKEGLLDKAEASTYPVVEAEASYHQMWVRRQITGN